MIRSLRRKFILIAMASLIGTMLLLCAAIGIGNYHATTNRVDRAIFILHQNGGSFLPPDSHSDPTNFNFQITPETPFETRYFIVELTPQKEIKSVNLDHIAALDRQMVVNTISQIIEAITVSVCSPMKMEGIRSSFWIASSCFNRQIICCVSQRPYF